MKVFLFITLSIVLQSIFFESGAQEIDGTALFNTNCAACHTIGGGKLVGPDLKGVAEKHDKTWIYRFVRESQMMIEEGDEQAVAVFNANSMIPMPPMPLSDEQIDALLNHIAKVSKEEPEPEPVVVEKKVVTPAKVAKQVESKLSTDHRVAIRKAMMTGLWIALGASIVMIVGIWFAFNK